MPTMFLLLACAPAESRTPPPALTLGVKLPPAQHASALPAARFVGPLDVAGLDAAALCGELDRAALLREGRYGWRVLGLSGGNVRLPDGTVESLEGDAPALRALAARWVAADEAYAERCGRAPETALLIAPDAEARHVLPSKLLGLRDLAGYAPAAAWLLVDDSIPDATPTPPADRIARPHATLTIAPGSTALLWSAAPTGDGRYEAAEGEPEALVARIDADAPVVLATDPALPWGALVRGLDALAGRGFPVNQIGAVANGRAASGLDALAGRSFPVNSAVAAPDAPARAPEAAPGFTGTASLRLDTPAAVLPFPTRSPQLIVTGGL